MFSINDNSVFRSFEEDELQNPCPRKILEGRTIYTSRALNTPKEIGAPVLCDFSSAVLGTTEHSEDVQPNIYRAPEVIIEAPWSYSIDIWNVACMVKSQLSLCVGNVMLTRHKRFGTFMKADICLQDTTLSMDHTVVEPILWT